MSTADTTVRARIDPETKTLAARALEAAGLSIPDAIRLLMQRIAVDQKLPFDVTMPNAATREAIAQLQAGEGDSYASIADLMDDLHAID